jgi:hypothetical protein
MNQKLIDKISLIYKEAKVLAEKYSYSDVMFNTGETQTKIMDEWARQVNITNELRQKEKDLNFVLTLLQEARSNLSNTPRGQNSIKQIDIYMDNIRSLLKVYFTISQMQSSILKYYERGGATF